MTKNSQRIAETDTNYELVVKHDQKIFLAKDPKVMAKNTQLSLKDSTIVVPYFGVNFLLNIETAEITYAENPNNFVDVNIRMMILHHLINAKDGAKSAVEFVTMHSLKDCSIHTDAFRNRAILPLAKFFEGNLNAFHRAGEIMGGTFCKGGDCAFILYAFPTIPIQYLFWDGDDEVPAAANILFDRNVTDFTHPEDVIGLGEHGAYYIMDCLNGNGGNPLIQH